jgi:ribonuclease G
VKKQVLVSVDRGETRVALLEATGTPAAKPSRGRGRRKANPAEGYRVAELYLERRSNRSIVGNIYKGRVDNVLPGLEAAFVDIGLDKNGFLHVDEIVLPGVQTPRRGRGKEGGQKISDLLKPGQDVVVQVVKDPLKTKGARLSMELTIAGRYMVYAPTGEGVGVSKRLDDKERERLRRAAKGLELRSGGVIIRTAASGAKREDFERELQYLFKLHEVLEQRVKTSPAQSLVFQEADLSVRVVRDIFSEHFERAVVDDEKQHHRLVSFFSRTAPELVDRVELYQESTPLFEEYGVEEVILGLVSRRVDLPSGGYLMIDYAEALTVIDVNSGSFVGRGKQARLEDTITRTNLEAAEAVVNELRLRDIGGIIVIDFIDMARVRNREAVLKTLRRKLDEDRTKTFTAEISKLGLVEMTRQNVTEGVREIMTRACPTCDGDGVVLSEETVAIEFERKMRELASRAPRETEAFLVQMNPRVSGQFTGNGARVLHLMEVETGKHFLFTGSEGLPLDYFDVVTEGSLDEIRDQAIPFREGDEVFVTIVEPHMYAVDDAVAKIDGYIVSVAQGGSHVGEKRLVRIVEVGRTAANAVLVDNGASGSAAGAGAAGAASGSGRARSRRSGDDAKDTRRSTAASRRRAAAPAQDARDDEETATRFSREDAPEPATAGASPGERDGEAAADRPARRVRRATAPEDGDAVSPDAAAAAAAAADGETEVAPKPRRRRSRAAAATAPAPEADAGPVAETDAAASPDEDAAEEAPKPRRLRSRAASATAVAADPEGEGEAGAASPGAAVAGDEEAPKPAPRRRGSRGSGRTKAAAAEDAEPQDADAGEAPEGAEDTPAADGEESTEGDVVESTTRRRGRRGGRRRSAAKADATSE